MFIHRTLCLCLILSATFLVGFLFCRSAPTAEAGMISGTSVQMLTAKTANSEDSLFYMDSAAGKMSVYRVAAGGRSFDLIQSFDVARDLFGEGAGTPTKPGKTPPKPR